MFPFERQGRGRGLNQSSCNGWEGHSLLFPAFDEITINQFKKSIVNFMFLSGAKSKSRGPYEIHKEHLRGTLGAPWWYICHTFQTGVFTKIISNDKKFANKHKFINIQCVIFSYLIIHAPLYLKKMPFLEGTSYYLLCHHEWCIPQIERWITKELVQFHMITSDHLQSLPNLIICQVLYVLCHKYAINWHSLDKAVIRWFCT